ncbi:MULTISPECIES: ImmA/IrrE family metallo-endopeptidase [Staphylococcus]|nr:MULTISPECIES: ImmA/IrrE family metallo-endopeptidase [Staphylococcus]MCE4953514.1 ImmA/IrrE family metallo-endopeptidase [Staphylococcus haemolyticus]OFQ58487.1 toxin [Staphylococcus sp. HMSC068C09]PTK81941.1 ImmA/IrrE family metallo-endopeptidase [Staphylococcus haemolyticus]PTL13653.1 ImmA/IrrE family metallo-endopeptidase [Staphylococcus haemolyticus]
MSRYEQLLTENEHIKIRDTHSLPDGYSGFYNDGIILIDKNLPETRKAEVLYEELAHHKLTYGNILDQSKWINRKFESYARRHGYEAALPLRIIVEAHHYGVSNLYELAEYVQLSEEHVLEILEYYKTKHGLTTRYGKYVIQFEPLRVFEYKDI